jgi:hypothetical protein
MVAAACSGPVTAPTRIPTATVAPTPSSSATVPSTPTSRASFAMVCGDVSNFVSDSAGANGSFVLNSRGRDPLRITIPAGRLGGGVAANHVCIEVLGGIPDPVFAGFVPGGAPQFIAPETFPATRASPAPTGFTLPQACAYVAPPTFTFGTDQTAWQVDCGTASNNARGILGAALSQQGWRSCASGLASAQWQKSEVMLAVSESSLAPGDYPRLTQYARVTSPCS